MLPRNHAGSAGSASVLARGSLARVVCVPLPAFLAGGGGGLADGEMVVLASSTPSIGSSCPRILLLLSASRRAGSCRPTPGELPVFAASGAPLRAWPAPGFPGRPCCVERCNLRTCTCRGGNRSGPGLGLWSGERGLFEAPRATSSRLRPRPTACSAPARWDLNFQLPPRRPAGFYAPWRSRRAARGAGLYTGLRAWATVTVALTFAGVARMPGVRSGGDGRLGRLRVIGRAGKAQRGQLSATCCCLGPCMCHICLFTRHGRQRHPAPLARRPAATCGSRTEALRVAAPKRGAPVTVSVPHDPPADSLKARRRAAFLRRQAVAGRVLAARSTAAVSASALVLPRSRADGRRCRYREAPSACW